MNNAELIDALQCTSHFALYQDCYDKNCYANSGKGLYCNIPKLMADAADALKAAEKRIDGLQKLVDINTQRCEALREQLREAHESYEKHIAELEARLPKEGECEAKKPKTVKETEYSFYCDCPTCGGRLISNVDGEWCAGSFDRFCRMCGQKIDWSEYCGWSNKPCGADMMRAEQ